MWRTTTWLYPVGVLLIAIAYRAVYKRHDRTLRSLLGVGVALALLLGARPLVDAQLELWRHERALLVVQEGELAVRTLLLTKRGLSRLIAEAEEAADVARLAEQRAAARARLKAINDKRRSRHRGEVEVNYAALDDLLDAEERERPDRDEESADSSENDEDDNDNRDEEYEEEDDEEEEESEEEADEADDAKFSKIAAELNTTSPNVVDSSVLLPHLVSEKKN